jgi:hypothetical protein
LNGDEEWSPKSCLWSFRRRKQERSNTKSLILAQDERWRRA